MRIVDSTGLMPAKAKNAVTWQRPEGQKAYGRAQKTLRNGSDPEMMPVKRKQSGTDIA
jgi:hypothetical protein